MLEHFPREALLLLIPAQRHILLEVLLFLQKLLGAQFAAALLLPPLRQLLQLFLPFVLFPAGERKQRHKLARESIRVYIHAPEIPRGCDGPPPRDGARTFGKDRPPPCGASSPAASARPCPESEKGIFSIAVLFEEKRFPFIFPQRARRAKVIAPPNEGNLITPRIAQLEIPADASSSIVDRGLQYANGAISRRMKSCAS